MLASAFIAATVLGLSGEQQAALDALIESRQTARIARLEAAADARRNFIPDFSSPQFQQARERKAARQMRLVAKRTQPHWPTVNMMAMQRTAVANALQRQFSPVYSYPLSSSRAP